MRLRLLNTSIAAKYKRCGSERIIVRSNVNSVVCSYLSPTPVGVGVGTSLIWAVHQNLLPARVWLRETMAEYCESSRLPEVGEVPHQTVRHISFQDASLASLKFSVALRIIVWNILSYFFMYVSVSNLHFPQMKLASEKPPEAILEGVIFKIFLGEHTSRPP